MSDLRTLAQAVVDLRGEIDALALEAKCLTGDDYKAATKRWWEMVRRLQKMNDDLRFDGLAERILAALDAADAQGYARAMGEVVERCEADSLRAADAPAYGGHEAGQQCALDIIADLARDRLPAAGEKEHGG